MMVQYFVEMCHNGFTVAMYSYVGGRARAHVRVFARYTSASHHARIASASNVFYKQHDFIALTRI